MQNYLKQFEISDHQLIRSTLRELLRYAGSIYLIAREQHEFSVPARLIRFDSNAIEFEPLAGEPSLDAMVSGRAPYVLADLGFVQVQFDLHGLRLNRDNNRCVLASAFPQLVYRIQRREGLRVRPFSAEKIVCNVRNSKGQFSTWRVLDLSVIGLAMQVPAGTVIPPIGTIIEHAQLEVGTDSPIPVHLAVRRCWVPNDAPASGEVLGCEFQYLDQNNERRLQVLITDIERHAYKQAQH
jgi:c-di-GMP-binding flagellar brake protein YcgR